MVCSVVGGVLATSAQAVTITSSTDAAALAAALVTPGSGISIVGGTEIYQGGADQGGTYSGFSISNSSKTITLGDGVVLTTGSVSDIPDNDSSSVSVTQGAGTDADLDSLVVQTVTDDVNLLSFDFTADPGITSVDLNFVFGSDEFPDQDVTDVFGVFVDGVNYAEFSDGSVINFELGSISAGFFNDNDFGSSDPFADSDGTVLEYDGIVDALKITGLLDSELTTHSLKIAIGDTSDTVFDSGVFITGLGGGTTDTGGIGEIPDDVTTPPDPSVVPLPAGMPLLIAGLAGFAFLRRRSS